MKKLLLLVIAFSGFSLAQYHQDGWGVGFGINSVRYTGDVVGEDLNFGANVYIQRDLSRNAGFRMKVDYNKFTGTNFKVETNHLNLSLGYIFRFYFSDYITPYVGAGFSTMYAAKTNKTLNTEQKLFGEISADIFFGAYFDWLGDNWLLKGEFSQHTISTDKFDYVSIPGNGGLFGGGLDSYIQFEGGVIYFWESTPYVAAAKALPSGVRTKMRDFEPELDALQKKLDKAMTELASLQARLKDKPVPPKEPKAVDPVVKEVVKEAPKAFTFKPVYFMVNTTNLVPGSEKVLNENFDLLNANPSVNVVAEGHTDASGPMELNKKLSADRAQFVKDYLVKKGIKADRISTASFGPDKPAMENSTDAGRQLNRRVELKTK
ncbi:MAG: OmpA family protein [Ignavibacteriaceae bacterium]|nr:OmpA family protein [Ignavibacteriaceae bacterium]